MLTSCYLATEFCKTIKQYVTQSAHFKLDLKTFQIQYDSLQDNVHYRCLIV